MNDSSKISLLFTIPKLKLNLPGCDTTAYRDLGDFQFGNRQWELKHLKANGDGYDVISTYPIIETSRWDGIGLIVRTENDADIDSIKKSANEICWLLSLWEGQYVTWKNLYSQAGSSWQLKETAPTVESDAPPALRAHALCAPTLFIENTEPYFKKYSSAFIHTTHWLCRAFTSIDARVQSLVLSMIYERLVSAVYYGKKRTKTTFGKRAKYCWKIAGGTYTQALINRFIQERNDVVHGSDIPPHSPNEYLAYLTDLTAVVYATTLAMLGYEAGFSVRNFQTNVSKLYHNIHQLSSHSLNFKYK